MQKQLFPVFLLALTLTACKHSDETKEAMDSISRSLASTNEVMINSNDRIYQVLDKKNRDRRQRDKAIIWNPKALRVKKLSDSLCAYIDSLQQQIQLPGTGNNDIRLLLNSQSDRLYTKLSAYTLAAPAVIDTAEFTGMHPYFIENLKKDLIAIKKMIARQLEMGNDSIDARKWASDHFNDATPSLASMMLHKFKNNVLTIENILIEYCNHQAVTYYCGFGEMHSFIGITSSGRVKAGQTIEINAGKGDFSSDTNPAITIYDSTLAINTDGTVTYTFTAKGKPGKYYVPVKMAYYEPDGRRLTVTRQLEYIIGE